MAVLRREPITPDIVNMIKKHLGMGAIIARIGDIDLKKGCGNLGNGTKIMWTKDKCRITITYSLGTTMADCSKTPDPECPEDL